jgi:histidyl-tRNA synthetase
MFRRERPQKGRYRQFHQIGAEAFGIAEPAIDAEQIAMVQDWLSRLGVTAALKLNSVGDPACRPAYLADLRAYLDAHAGELCGDCRERAQKNPLRVLDCKVPTCQPVLQAAPQLLARLCEPCASHFAAVRAGLDALGVVYTVEPRLVRGLDYYVRTAYEFSSDALGAQSAVAGGGRYDGLVETLGGPPTPGVGFALGAERLALILEALGRPIPFRPPAVFLVSADAAGAAAVLRISSELRRGGVACDLDARGGKLARQFKQAERVGARFALVLGSRELEAGEANLKEMATRVEMPVKLAGLAARLREIAP